MFAVGSFNCAAVGQLSSTESNQLGIYVSVITQGKWKQVEIRTERPDATER